MSEIRPKSNAYFNIDVTDKVVVINLREKAFEIITELEPCKMFISTLDSIDNDHDATGMILIIDQSYREDAAIKSFLNQIFEGGKLNKNELSKRLDRFVHIGERLNNAFDKFSKPLVVGIQTTITHELLAQVLPFDYRLASRSIVSVFPNIKMGVPPSGNLVYQFQHFIGHGKTKELLLSGEPLSAKQLFDLGLVSQLVDNEDMLEACKEKIKELSMLPPHSFMASRIIMGSDKDNYIRFMKRAKDGHKYILAHLGVEANLSRPSDCSEE